MPVLSPHALISTKAEQFVDTFRADPNITMLHQGQGLTLVRLLQLSGNPPFSWLLFKPNTCICVMLLQDFGRVPVMLFVPTSRYSSCVRLPHESGKVPARLFSGKAMELSCSRVLHELGKVPVSLQLLMFSSLS